MKVVVTSQGADLDSDVDPRFGRAKGFLVVDTETGACELHGNEQNLNAAQGAGVQSGRNVAELEVDAVITGYVGPKAFATLTAAGVKIYVGAKGTVKEALEKFKAGELATADQATVEGHWV